MTPLDTEITELLVERWIEPAIAQRERAGTLAKDETFNAVQVIFMPDGQCVVRFNEEVIGSPHLQVADPSVEWEIGSVVNIEETFEKVVAWQIQSDDPRVGFATLFLFRGEWTLLFNAAHNISPAKDHLEAAREFLDAASDSIERGRARVAVESLFSATELINKAFLFTFPCFAGASTHGGVSSEFSRISRFHAFTGEYTRLVSTLPGLRASARYLKGAFPLNLEHLRTVTRVANDFLIWIEETIRDTEENFIRRNS